MVACCRVALCLLYSLLCAYHCYGDTAANIYTLTILTEDITPEDIIAKKDPLVSSLFDCITACERSKNCISSSVVYQHSSRTCSKLPTHTEGQTIKHTPGGQELQDLIKYPYASHAALVLPDDTLTLQKSTETSLLIVGHGCEHQFIFSDDDPPQLVADSTLPDLLPTATSGFVLFLHYLEDQGKFTVCVEDPGETCLVWNMFQGQSEWAEIDNPAPTDLTHSSYIFLSDQRTVWFLGSWMGNTDWYGTLNSLHYDIYEETWSAGPVPPFHTKLSGMVSISDNEILIFGGLHSGIELTTSYIYNTFSGEWTATGPLPIGNFVPQGVLITDSTTGKRGVLSMTGGNRRHEMLWFDLELRTWSVKAGASFPFGYHGKAITAHGRIYIAILFVGDNPIDFTISSEILEVDPETLVVTKAADTGTHCGTMAPLEFKTSYLNVVPKT